MIISRKSVLILIMICAMVVSGCAKKKKIVVKPPEEPGVGEKWGVGPIIPLEDRRYEVTDALETVYFDFDRANLKTNTKDVLERNTQWLKDNPEEWVKVEGHCDERGTEEYNIALGERRAEGVRKYYVALGVEDSRIAVLSWGEEKPADPRHSEAAWSKNRKAETLLRVK